MKDIDFLLDDGFYGLDFLLFFVAGFIAEVDSHRINHGF